MSCKAFKELTKDPVGDGWYEENNGQQCQPQKVVFVVHVYILVRK